jgi:pimeloyl-ACP methyl ester carboxylesterase
MAMRDRPDSSTVLHKITCPTLLIAGENDVITRVEECREMAETIEDGTFVSIRDAGHLSNLENPTDFNRTLKDFLS